MGGSMTFTGRAVVSELPVGQPAGQWVAGEEVEEHAKSVNGKQ